MSSIKFKSQEDEMFYKSYINDIKNYDSLTPEEQNSLSKKMKNGDKVAKEKFINSNLKFVISVANSYSSYPFSFMDLINEGNKGLLSAIDNFDPDSGFKFSTYAVYWIKQSIQKYIDENSRSIRIPANQILNLNKINKVKKELDIVDVSSTDLSKIANYTDLDESLVKDLLTIEKPFSSLDKECDDDGELIQTYNFIEDKSTKNPEDELLNKEMKSDINKFLAVLNEKEAEIISKRFGLNGYKEGISLQEISKDYNLTKERIRQIEKKAMEKLSNSKEKENISYYVS